MRCRKSCSKVVKIRLSDVLVVLKHALVTMLKNAIMSLLFRKKVQVTNSSCLAKAAIAINMLQLDGQKDIKW